jgi:indole-3-glycerol phosphate synthase
VPDLLAAIVASTQRTVESRRARASLPAIERQAASRRRPAITFAAAIGREVSINVIAECKRRSPSKGVLRERYDPVAIAREYADAGAAAISVLTEPSFFDGSLDHLRAIGEAVDRPLLRKEFIVDEYQLVEAIGIGADAVLLIVSALAQPELERLHRRAGGLGLDVLVEVHDREELSRAIDAGATIIGVNNRNLRTLEVSVGVSEELGPLIPSHVIAVAESGLRDPEELRRLRALGYRAFLIGERLMTLDSPGRGLRELCGALVGFN